MSEHEEVLRWGMWVYKTQNLKRGEKSPPIFSHWKRYFMWFNKGSVYYGEKEGKPEKSIPVATFRGAERIAFEEFEKRKPPTLLADFGWILKTVDKTMIFVSDSESQCAVWVDGINAMLPNAGRQASEYGSIFDPICVAGQDGPKRAKKMRPEEADLEDIVGIGTFCYKLKGETGKKSLIGHKWERMWICMEDEVLWYGPENNKRASSLEVRSCHCIDTPMQEEMYMLDAPDTLHGFGIRMRAPGDRCFVFACLSETATIGWYRNWRKIIPMSAEQLAQEAETSYISNLERESKLEEKNRILEEQRKQGEYKRRKSKRDEAAHLMADNLEKAMKQQDKIDTSTKLQREELQAAQKAIIKENEKHAKAIKEEDMICRAVQRRIREEEGIVDSDGGDDEMDTTAPYYPKQEIERRVKKHLVEARMQTVSEQAAAKDAERECNMKRIALANELQALEKLHADVMDEATHPKKVDNRKCCVIA